MFWTTTVSENNSSSVDYGTENSVLHLSQACITSKGPNTLIVNTKNNKKATLCVLDNNKFPFSSLDLYFTREEIPKFGLIGNGEICLTG